MSKVIFSNDYIKLIEEDDGFYIESYKKGYTLEEFNQILSDFPQIRITNFVVLRNTILNAPKFQTKFAEKEAGRNYRYQRPFKSICYFIYSSI